MVVLLRALSLPRWRFCGLLRCEALSKDAELPNVQVAALGFAAATSKTRPRQLLLKKARKLAACKTLALIESRAIAPSVVHSPREDSWLAQERLR